MRMIMLRSMLLLVMLMMMTKRRLTMIMRLTMYVGRGKARRLRPNGPC